METLARLETFGFYFIYDWLLRPVLHLGFFVASFVNPKIREGLRMRGRDANGVKPWLNWPRGQNPIWIHCASGELEYAKPVITRLKCEAPGLKILVTYFSPSVARAAREFGGVDFACPAPWDRVSALREFIDWHRPKALVIARTDTWPEMLRQAKVAFLPTLLFSATMPSEAGRARGLGRWMSRAVFQYLDRILCVSSDDAAVFSSLGISSKIEVGGDTRYDQVLTRLENPKPISDSLFESTSRANCFIAGSTWDEDEDVLISAAASMRAKKHPEIRFVLVPHEPTPEHIARLQEKLRNHDFTASLYSAGHWQKDSVLIVDRVGLLAELYCRGRFAFVGGSFRKSVHSVMEPLAAGCLTFVGPRHLNNREALEFKTLQALPGHATTCVESVCTADEMVNKITQALTLPESQLANSIRQEIKTRAGRSDHVARVCLDLISRASAQTARP